QPGFGVGALLPVEGALRIAEAARAAGQARVEEAALGGAEGLLAAGEDAAAQFLALAPLGAVEVDLGVGVPDAELLAAVQPGGRQPQPGHARGAPQEGVDAQP